jgi:hypothetical protein
VRLAPHDGFASGKVIEKLTAGKAVFQIEKQKITEGAKANLLYL